MRKFLFCVLISIYCLTAYAKEEIGRVFTLSSKAFYNQNTLPILYTCDGKDVSPELHWTTIPPNTQSFALIFKDLDAPSGIFYHWVIYNLPKHLTTLAKGAKLPKGALIGTNSWGKKTYAGPCPPLGSVHNYVFTLYAVDTKLPLTIGADAEAVIKALQNHVVGMSDLTVRYGH